MDIKDIEKIELCKELVENSWIPAKRISNVLNMGVYYAIIQKYNDELLSKLMHFAKYVRMVEKSHLDQQTYIYENLHTFNDIHKLLSHSHFSLRQMIQLHDGLSIGALSLYVNGKAPSPKARKSTYPTLLELCKRIQEVDIKHNQEQEAHYKKLMSM